MKHPPEADAEPKKIRGSSISRAQMIVNLLGEALQEIRNYKKQSIAPWQKVLLEEVDGKISSALSDVEEGFSRYVNMNTMDKGFRNFLIVVDKESLEVLAVWRGEQETEENRDVIEKKLNDRLEFLVREYCDSPDKKGRYDIVMARAKEFAGLKNQLYELHGWKEIEQYLM